MSEEKALENEQTADLAAVTEVEPSKNETYVCVRDDFDSLGLPDGVPLLISPKTFKDERGCFCVSVNRDYNEYEGIEEAKWMSGILDRTVQINRSISKPGVFRGFHAQKAPNCQGKLVECVSDTPVWDVIMDARPASKSFQQFTVFKLTGSGMEKVWVPRGFLHGFLVPRYDVKREEDGSFTRLGFSLPAQIQYFADNHYSPEDEVCVSPAILLQIVVNTYRESFEKDPKTNYAMAGFLQTCLEDVGEDGGLGNLILSDKDLAGEDIKDFLERVDNEFKESGTSWHG